MGDRRLILGFEKAVDLFGRHFVGMEEVPEAVVLGSPLEEALVTCFAGEAVAIRFFGETQVGIVLSKGEAVLCPGGKETVGFVYPFRDEVIYEDADVGLFAGEGKGREAEHFGGGIDAGDNALSSGLFVAGGAVDLAGMKEVVDELGFEGRVKLVGLDKVVLNRIARAKQAGLFETGDVAKGFGLDRLRKGGGEAIEVNLYGVPTLGLDEKLMAFAFGEADDFIFNGGAVAGANALDAAGEKGRLFEAARKDLVNLGVRISDPAGLLVLEGRSGEIGEATGGFVAGLSFEPGVVYGSAIQTGRGAGFHAAGFEAQLPELFGKAVAGGFANAPTCHLLKANMDHTPQEGTRGKDDGMTGEGFARAADDALDAFFVGGEEEGDDTVLPEMEGRDLFQVPAPAGGKARAIILRTGTP